ncbi:HNH endonuclease signature motif containing protein [Streptomyces californicus]|uniref:HNH endonuclease signature motif containing protein n=1 Tax=Streptomyces californicus TaxID=67351 RepID=UPI00099C82F8|nr:HNH endonuclease signature motif containing protein [Streptomyces californicus]QRV59417.1 HNH endonuclease [Streptomyces californicus]
MTGIQWTPVPGHRGYEVTRTGQMRGPRGKVMHPMAMSTGHLYVITGDRRKLWVHHAVLLAFVGPRPEGQECRHLDGNPRHNHADNLAWGTRTENMRDKAIHGTEPTGEQKANHRITAEQARAIRVDTRPARVVGRDYGISHTAILRIRRGERWRAA